MKPIRRIVALISMALSIGALPFFGCEEATEPKPEDQQLPLSNERILNQVLLGSSSSYSSVYNLYDDGKGAVFFRGLLNNTNTIGKMARNGTIVWTNALKSRELYPVPNNTIGLNDALLAVGGIDYDGDGGLDQGYVRLRGAGGASLSEAIASVPDTAVYLNSVAVIDSLHFVAVGGAYIAGLPIHPYIITFDLNADSSLTITNEHIFSGMEWQYFNDVVSDPAKTTADEFSCYATVTKQNAAGATAGAAVCAVGGPKRGGAAFGVQWTVNIEQSSTLPIWINALTLRGNTVFVAGSADAAEKALSGGGYFDNGFIASISSVGVLNWFKTVNISKRSDNYSSVFATSSALYVAGRVSHYMNTEGNTQRGLALLSVFDPATGNARHHIAFGNYDYQSAFYSLFVDGTSAFCSGSTKYSVLHGTYQGWYVEINCSGLGASGLGESHDMTVPGSDSAEECPDRRDSRSGSSLDARRP